MSKCLFQIYLIRHYWKDLIISIVVIVGVTTWMQRNMLPPDSQAINFELKALDGSTKHLFAPSQRTLVYFFAPWCTTCKLSMSNLDSVSASINIVAVALDYHSRTAVTDFIEAIQVDVPVLLGNPQIASSYKVSAYPSYYVIGNDGKILGRSMGYSSLAGLLWRTR